MPGGAVGEEETTTRDEEATGAGGERVGNGKKGRKRGEVAEGWDRKNGAAAGCLLVGSGRVSARLCGLACGAAGLGCFNWGLGFGVNYRRNHRISLRGYGGWDGNGDRDVTRRRPPIVGRARPDVLVGAGWGCGLQACSSSCQDTRPVAPGLRVSESPSEIRLFEPSQKNLHSIRRIKYSNTYIEY